MNNYSEAVGNPKQIQITKTLKLKYLSFPRKRESRTIEMMNKVLETTKFVVDNSKFVKIDNINAIEFASTLNYEDVDHWLSEAPFDFNALDTDEEKLHFLFILDSTSFSYWGDPKWTLEYKNKQYDGAMGMIAVLGRAMEEDMPILDFSCCANMSEVDFAKMLRANMVIPLFEKRLEFLREIGKVVVDRYQGKLKNMINEARGDTMNLLDIILKNFPPFKDDSVYKGKEIYFFKRAQLFISDIYEMFNGMSFGRLQNISQLTACADYKLPQILRKLGILVYKKDLADRVDNKIEILHNSDEEIEIRANTIWAVEQIKEAARTRIQNIRSTEINDHLWLLSQKKLPDDKPYHRTRTAAY